MTSDQVFDEHGSSSGGTDGQAHQYTQAAKGLGQPNVIEIDQNEGEQQGDQGQPCPGHTAVDKPPPPPGCT